MLSIVSLSFVECSAGCRVNSIVRVFEVFRNRSLCLIQLNMFFRYECTCCSAVFMFVWIERTVMSSAYITCFILLFGGVGMSDG